MEILIFLLLCCLFAHIVVPILLCVIAWIADPKMLFPFVLFIVLTVFFPSKE